MEDRHSVSNPRPFPGGGSDGVKVIPTWEVDIIRDGSVIVDTFVLNNEVLPPRKNKKGKVLWSLPKDLNKTPSFGVHENSRILDIFKDRKKKRKKQLKESGGKASESPKKRESLADSGEEGGGKLDRRDSKGNGNAKSKKSGKENGKSDENNVSVTAKEKDVRAGKHPQLQAARMRLGGIGQRQNKKQHQSDILDGDPISPSSMQMEASGSLITLETEAPDTVDLSRLSLDDAAPTKQQSPNETSRPAAKAPSSAAPSPDALFIVIPRNELPNPLPGETELSLAVPAARHFVNTYYQHFSAAQINDLGRYYTAKGQKSVSIGGAHSVVTGRNDIATQILSLAGTVFSVRGVVSQDTVDGQGAHILVTGSAVTGSGGVSANFAHSVSLTRVKPELQVESTCPALTAAFEAGIPFQIHNDALALLSGEAAPMNQPQFTSPAPAHHPPPPPGLF
eukprot:scaffold1508_cov108-Skeletonema_marinoi.AAC.5